MTLTIIVFSLFCLILFLIGFKAKKKKDESDLNYFLGNRNLNAIQIGLSAGATGNTGFIMTGAVGLGYSLGIDWLFLPFAWFLGDLIFWKFFPHKLNQVSHKKQIISPITYVTKNRIFMIILSLVLIVSIGSYAATQFIAAAKSLTGFFGIGQNFGVSLTVIVILGYLLFGGFPASVRTDIIQAVMMILITCIVLYDVINRYDIINSYSFLATNAKNAFIVPFYKWSIPTIIGFFFGWSSAAIGFGLGQPQIISRYFAGQSVHEVKKAKWTYIIFLQFTWLGMTLFGYLLGLSRFEANDPEAALAEYALKFFSPILGGIILAGIFSAIASTIDSICLSISTTISKNIFNREFKKEVKYLILFFVICVIGAISFAIETSSSTVFVLAKLSISLMASSLGLAILLKFTLSKISDKSLLIGVFFSFVTCIIWYSIGFSKLIVESLPSLIIGFLISYLLYKRQLK
jgi:Na+/proline symporter